MGFGFSISDHEISFDAALYYITVTCSTVGYGDYTPKNELSQIIILVFIVTIIFIVTKTTSDFNDLSKVNKISKFHFNFKHITEKTYKYSCR